MREIGSIAIAACAFFEISWFSEWRGRSIGIGIRINIDISIDIGCEARIKIAAVHAGSRGSIGRFRIQDIRNE